MIGIFDSGVGGKISLYEIRRLLPRADIVYLADRKNAPYGTKSPSEILRLVSEDIRRLRERGAEKILIACCTASTVWERLSESEREISLPIIRPAALTAARVSGGAVTVIATEATVKSGAFKAEIKRLSPTLTVTEIAAQELVSLVEGGAADGRLTPRDIKIITATAERIKETKADTLVLGCTHFSHLEKTLEALTGAKTVSPAKEGAMALAREPAARKNEGGRVIYS